MWFYGIIKNATKVRYFLNITLLWRKYSVCKLIAGSVLMISDIFEPNER